MTNETKQKVREFYDEIGWQQEDDGHYQNARYEDLRPVSREYIHKTRLRVMNGLIPTGDLLLDAGSGPVQYEEYKVYSQGYKKRVCLDISIQALREARNRIGDHGIFVVGDLANLPFKSSVFDGVISMHAVHHLPLREHRTVYEEFHRVTIPGRKIVVVNGWYRPLLARMTRPFVQLKRFLSGRPLLEAPGTRKNMDDRDDPTGTFVQKMTPEWFKKEFKGVFNYKLYSWRSLSPRLLINFVHPKLGGKFILKVVFLLEEWFPAILGVIGVYPMVVFKKD
jgi:SAM-dependent methyltransferase